MSQPIPDFAFGSFNHICSTVSLTLCPLVGAVDGIEPRCYSRNIKLGDSLIFQPCKLSRRDKKKKVVRLSATVPIIKPGTLTITSYWGVLLFVMGIHS